MKADIIQTSFAGGEFGPSLYGRTDISQYQNACQIVQNFLVRPQGSVISMPGTKYCATVSDSTLNTRLMKFVFNRADSYAIEAGDLYMRFFTNRGQVVTASGVESLATLTSSTIAHYKMNDNAADTIVLDTSGSHNATSTTNTNVLHATGKVGTGCFDFDNLYYVRVPNHADFNFSDTNGTVPFSVVGWVYFENNGAIYQGIASKWAGGKQEWYFIIFNNSKLRFALYDLPNAAAAVIEAPITEGWHFVAFTYDGRGGANASDGMNLYIDATVPSGVTRNTSAGYEYVVNNTAEVQIGAFSSAYYFKNKIDEVSFFNKALSAVEIASLYSVTAYQLTTVYTEDEINNVQYAQLNDVIWLAHPNHPPQRLVRTSADEWAIADFDFLGGPFLDENTTATTITPSATAGTINITVTPTNANLFTVSTSTLGHQNSYWMIGGLSLTNATTGLQETGYVEITHVINSYTVTATVIKSLKAATATTRWAEGAWSAVRGYPARVAFHERRLWFSRTTYEPQKVWGSKVFEYDNFALDTQDDDDALNLALASNESNEIQWVTSGKSLIAGTYGGAFIINSGSSEPITPSNVNASEEVGIGVTDIVPQKIGSFLYYVQRFGKKLRELFYSWDIDTYKAVDRTILSPHILGDGIVSMDVQTNPNSMLYCVLTNGTLATFTREVDQDFAAWSKHTTNGTYTSVAIIPSQTYDYDEAWVIVERWINGSQKKYVEYFENPNVPDRQDLCLYLHSALTYNAYEKTSLSTCTISLSASVGSVTVTSNTAYFVGTHINKRLRAIDIDGDTIGEGVITATSSTTSLTLSITTTFDALTYSAGYWGISVVSLSGLDHLEAETVGILADGKTESLTRTVASGVVTFGTNYFVVHAGLSYDQILYTLPKEAGTVRGTAQGKFQRFNEIALKVNRSTQAFKYGPNDDDLDDVNLAFTPTVTTLYTGIIPPQTGGLAMRGGYERGAVLYLKNSNPLPLEILSIMGTLDTADK